jgi:hypothetical protein
LLCCVVVAAGVVLDPEGAGAPLRDVLAAALEANQEMARLAAELRAENAEQRAELERLRADRGCLAADAVRAVVGAVASGPERGR